MIEKMDAEYMGGNGDGHISKNEFLAFLGHASDVWAMEYTSDRHEKVPDPWGDDEKTVYDIRNAKADWSFLWEAVRIEMLWKDVTPFELRKEKWIIDKRSQDVGKGYRIFIIAMFLFLLV